MTAYLVSYGADLNDRLAIHAFPDRLAASRATHLVPNVPPDHNGGGAWAIWDTPADVVTGGPGIVALYNALCPISPVKRFESRDAGIRRIFQLLPTIAKEPKMNDATIQEQPATPTDDRAEAQAKIAAERAERKAKRAAHLAELEAAKAAKKQERTDKKAAKEAEVAARRAQARQPQLGAFAQVRESSALGKVARAIFAGGATTDSLAALIGKGVDDVVARLKRARVTHGIDHAIVDGAVRLVLPDGKTEADLFKMTDAKPEPTGERKPQERIQKLFDDAKAGIMPEKPIVTSATNMHRQKHFDRLAAHADFGEWDKVVNYPPLGTDTYSKMIRRYRDLLLAAHAAQEARQAAE